MSQFDIRRREFTYSPANRASNETPSTTLALKKGDRLVFGSVVKKVLSTTANTIAIRVTSGGGGSAGGIIAAFDTSSGTAGDVLNCTGTDMTAGDGFLMTGDGSIEFDYVAVGGGGSVTPVIRFQIGQVTHEAIS